MLILADNDVGGAVAALQRILESEEWAEFSATLALRFIEFADVGLARDASDRVVWQTCQEVEAANRATTSFTLVGTSADFTLSAPHGPFWVMRPRRLGKGQP